MTHIADAIREVTIAMQKAIANGYRSRMIDADDLVEVLLSIADRPAGCGTGGSRVCLPRLR